MKEAQEEGQSSKQQKHGVQTSKASRKRKQVPGIVDEAPPVPAARKKRCDVVDKTNCQAEMVITKRGDQWVVTRLNLEHNHNLLAPALSKLLWSHRYLTDQEKAMIRTFTNVNVPNRKNPSIYIIFEGWDAIHKLDQERCQQLQDTSVEREWSE